jgi:hypothetical protein
MPSQETFSATVSAPLVALDEPTQTHELRTDELPQADVDFQEMFNSQGAAGTDEALALVVAQPPAAPQPLLDPEAVAIPEPLSVPEPVVMSGPAMIGGVGVCGCGVQNSCDAVITCRPYLTPNLPQSTFLQYFRSDRCHTNIWDGYRRHCGDSHKHLHGECDCFDRNRKSCLGMGSSNCGSCDACNR